MNDARIGRALKVERMGHEDRSMSGVYGHPTEAMRVELVELMQALWESAVAERFKVYPYSAIPLPDRELAKWRERDRDQGHLPNFSQTTKKSRFLVRKRLLSAGQMGGATRT
ncbi:hypothetical protein [Nonomuraea sp. SBT364]|uniref:hypothetical protein n=1 Tax=Nonomuraea sp. SBT364 TaxID=1580530 RepID=UPI0012E2E344|nr:hypothetical protein [Nonomuraea sp. SBT364]